MTPTVGKAVDRVDGPAKTTGKARYAAEFPYDGIAHAALTYATVTRGRITAIDTAEASSVPGVLAVLTHLNAPSMKPPPKPPWAGRPGPWRSPGWRWTASPW